MKKALGIFLLFAVSCTQEVYEKGDGEYSLMRGDFVEAHVNANKQIVSMTTDDGDQLPLSDPYSAKWITTGDTTYRCMLYYNKVEKSKGQFEAEVISIGQVPCSIVQPLKEFDKEFRTDPVKFESTWMSKTGRYLNFSLLLKTGITDDTTAVQNLAIVSDTLITHPDNKRILNLILHHDQDNVPEYYSTKVYFSIPTKRIDADSVQISINSYDGEVVVKHRIR